MSPLFNSHRTTYAAAWLLLALALALGWTLWSFWLQGERNSLTNSVKLYTSTPMPQKLPVLLNQTQLARALNIAPSTMAKRIKDGDFKPVSKNGKGRPLFEQPKSK